jgi:RNA polymerase sigma-70 factor (ECF subfamily)
MLHMSEPKPEPNSNPPELADEIVELLPALRAFARSLTRNAVHGDDLVQETLVKALANVDKFQPGTRLRAWLFTIMRNTFYTSARKSQREATGREDCVSGELTEAAGQEWIAFHSQVMQAVQRLPAHYRETLILVAMLGESYEDTARICGCTLGTVKSRVNRARQLLRDMLGNMEGTEL